jgi:hypothetical protein
MEGIFIFCFSVAVILVLTECGADGILYSAEEIFAVITFESFV